MTVSWSDAARDDLAAELAILGAFSATAADRLARGVGEAIDRLCLFPLSGRVVPEWEYDDLREVIVGRHRLIYRTSSDDLQIVAVHPSAVPLL